MFDMIALERLHQSTHSEQRHNTSLHQHGGMGIKVLDINHACKDELMPNIIQVLHDVSKNQRPECTEKVPTSSPMYTLEHIQDTTQCPV